MQVSDEWSDTDESYFVITVDQGNGRPVTKKFGPYDNVDTGTQRSVAEFVITKDDLIPPNPTALRVSVFENDEGDPEETAEAIQQKMVEISNEVSSLAGAAAGASGADAASGPGVGIGATASTVSGVLAGPIGALAAAGIVAGLGLGDDYVGEGAILAFNRPELATTPEPQGNFNGAPFNAKIEIRGGDEGSFDVFFDVLVVTITTVPA